jgi:hypothetical protein
MKILFNIQTKNHFFIRMAMNQRSRLVVAGIEVFAEVLADTAVVAELVAVADIDFGIEAVDTAVFVLSLLVSKRSRQ